MRSIRSSLRKSQLALLLALGLLVQFPASGLAAPSPAQPASTTASAQAGPLRQSVDPYLKAQADEAFSEAQDLYKQGDVQGTFQKLQEALTLYHNAGDPVDEGATLTYIGLIYYYDSQYDQALNYYNQALPIRQSVGDTTGVAVTLSNIGLVYRDQGQYDKALQYLQQALSTFQEQGDQQDAGTVADNIGSIYYRQGQYSQALDYYGQGLDIAQQTGDQQGESNALINIGLVYADQGNYDKALTNYQQALQMVRDIGDPRGEGSALNNIASVYQDQGEYNQALDFFNQALDVRRSSGDQAGEATALSNIGGVYNLQGEYGNALNYYGQALTLAQNLGDRRGEAIITANIGDAYDNQGQGDKALDYYNQALSIYREVGNHSEEANTLNNIGAVYYGRQDYAKALDYYGQALDTIRPAGLHKEESVLLGNMAAVYGAQKQYAKALDTFNQALNMERDLGDKEGQENTLNNIGYLYKQQQQNDQALSYYNQALPIAQEIGDKRGEGTILSNLGYASEAQNQLPKALQYLQQSLSIRETVRTGARAEELKTSLAALSSDVYDETVLLLDKLNEPEQAFNMAERARARTFLDQLGNTHLDVRHAADAQLVGQEQDLREQVTALDQKLSEQRAEPAAQQNPDLIKNLDTQLSTKQKDYADLLTRLKLSNPEYASLVSVSPLTLTDTQKLLDDKTTLLSYFVTADKTLAFVVGRTSFKMIELNVKQSDLQSATTDFRGFASITKDTPPSLIKLYNWLVAPVKQYLTTPVLGIVPNGVLHYLPFAALSADGKSYLSDDYVLFSLPSASALPYVQDNEKGKNGMPSSGASLLAMAEGEAQGLPALQNADKEAQAVASLYSAQPLLDKDATEAAFRQKAGESYIVHIAAHGQLNTTSPLFSRIVLAPGDGQGTGSATSDSTPAGATTNPGDSSAGADDGSVEVHEVYELDLHNTNLVVLSACQTDLGAQSKGDDIVGLNRAFIYAGTPSVIASLWSVDDQATSMLMTSFYTHLKAGEGKAEALRSAQQETRGKYPNPYYWAAFVLSGSPGQTKLFTNTLHTGSSGTANAFIIGGAFALLVLVLVLSGGAWFLLKRRSITLSNR